MRKPASGEITSDSVELCDTEVCFLHIQLLGKNVWLPKMHNVPPEVDFESSRSPAKSESWNNTNRQMLRRITHMTILKVITRVMSVEIQRAKRLPQLVQVCVQTKECQAYQFGPNIGISRRFESKLLTILQAFPVLPFRTWWSSRHGIETLYKCSVFLFASSEYRSTHFFAWPSIAYDHATVFALSFPILVISQSLQQRFVIRTPACIPQWCIRSIYIYVVYIPGIHGQEVMSVLPDQPISSIFSRKNEVWLSSSHSNVVHVHR